jgi:hypothetical protein
MKTIKVIAAGWCAEGMAMGDLVDGRTLEKKLSWNYNADGCDVTWTNISEDVIVDNGYDVIHPGESVTWEK